MNERIAVDQLSGRQTHAGKLDHPRLARIEPGRFGIDDNGVERQKRGSTTCRIHCPPSEGPDRAMPAGKPGIGRGRAILRQQRAGHRSRIDAID
ncbi:hypothetical protein [Bradyrhizobium liaoningense]